MKALVTGGRGGIGAAIVDALGDADTTVLDLPEFDVSDPDSWYRVTGEFDDRPRAQTAVEVVVQQNLRRPADLIRRRGVRDGLARHFRTLTPTRVDRPLYKSVDT